jgi:restriction system protein
MNGYIGTSWFGEVNLLRSLTDSGDWRAFNKEMIPVYLASHPETKKVAAGLFCGFTYTVGKTLTLGDIVLSPIGDGEYIVGEIAGGYLYEPNTDIPHRRKVNWYRNRIKSADFTVELKNSIGSIGTVTNLGKYASELDALIEGNPNSSIYTNDVNVEDASIFALEKHLEDFLIANWASTELSKTYDIYEAEGELIGQQFPTDTGPIDILAISKDKRELLVIELKKGRVSDVVVGQTQRYMGYVQGELAEPSQRVKGLIIGLNEDLRLKRALAVTQNIEFYRYQVTFKLLKGFKDS